MMFGTWIWLIKLIEERIEFSPMFQSIKRNIQLTRGHFRTCVVPLSFSVHESTLGKPNPRNDFS